MAEPRYIDIVFDGPPDRDGPRFIEVEDETGKSIEIGEWIERGNGLWALRIPRPGRGLGAVMFDGKLPNEARGLQLARIDRKGDLILCEAIEFVAGHRGVYTVLNRASVSGHVAIDGEIADHFADVLDAGGDIVETVSLDRRSYAALKNRWMRCKVQREN